MSGRTYDRNYGSNFYKRPIGKYVEAKLEMLKRDFCLRISYEEEMHMRSLKTEVDVDKYAHSLLREKL